MTDPVLPRECANKIFYLTSLSIISISTPVYLKIYDLILPPVLVSITSLLYWYNPVKRWRRNTDIMTVSIGSIYLVYRSFDCFYQILYLILLFGAFLFYVLSWMVYKKNHHLSTNLHCLVHIIGQFAYLILCAGVSKSQKVN
jgi:hypothetical protein